MVQERRKHAGLRHRPLTNAVVISLRFAKKCRRAIAANDQAIFGFAGLWDRSKRDDGTRVESCAIITMPASKLMSEIHNAKQRMPAILAREDRDAWLKGTPDEAFAALKQYRDAHLVATPVRTRVNAPKNNDPTLIEPIAA